MSDRRAETARRLRQRGLTYAEIARLLGCSRETASQLAYPRDPEEPGAAGRKRFEDRRSNPAYDRDPVWLGLRVPGTKP